MVLMDGAFSSASRKTISDEVIVDICISRNEGESKSGALFPNIQKLFVEAPCPSPSIARFLQVFLHDGLQLLDFTGRDIPSARREILSLAMDATRISPSLQTLCLWNSDWEKPFLTEWEEELGSIITRFTDLQRFETDMHGLSQPFLAALATQKKLQVIELVCEDVTADVTMENLRLPNVFNALSVKIAFPSLSNLDLRLNVTGVENIFGNGASFPCLNRLNLEVALNSDREELRRCLVQICSSCPELTSLHFFRYDNLPSPSSSNTKVVAPHRSTLPPGLQHLKPLHSLSNLRVFEYGHYWPIYCNDEELVECVGGLPRLRKLLLNSDPVWPEVLETDTCPTLAVLPDLARLLPEIRVLRLFVDTSVGVALKDTTPIAHTFKSLTSLSFGASDLPPGRKEWDEILLLLGLLFPPDSCVDASPSLYGFRVLEGEKERLEKTRNEWKALNGLLQIALQVRVSAMRSIRDGRSELKDWISKNDS